MGAYSVAERRNKTIKLLNDEGQVSVTKLSKMLGVSEVTIRKDLLFLEEKNFLVRTHGGAMKNDYLVHDQHIEDKGKKYADEKRRIGECAAKMVEDGESLILDAGTTVLQVARNLQNKRNLTVLTPAVNIALELIRVPEIQIMVMGGVLRNTSAAVIGSYAETMVREHFCSKLFLAADGFDLVTGLTTTNALEANLNRLMIESANETIVVMDSSKFGSRGLSRICGMDQIDVIITDEGISENMRKTLEANNIQVVIA
ncbi:transcriptional repressor AgaR [Balneolales bacterium ANBcel1]|nr:transcriptional repressor AgaR [Balneolales bacterium ANBcel1]